LRSVVTRAVPSAACPVQELLDDVRDLGSASSLRHSREFYSSIGLVNLRVPRHLQTMCRRQSGRPSVLGSGGDPLKTDRATFRAPDES
jgi:hypothetical protein